MRDSLTPTPVNVSGTFPFSASSLIPDSSSAYKEVREVLFARLQASPKGLTATQVLAARAEHGWNRLPRGGWFLGLGEFLSSLSRQLVRLLLGSLVALFLLESLTASSGGWLAAHGDSLLLASVLLLYEAVALFMRKRSGRVLKALEALTPEMANVWRDGVLVSLRADQLVPGDRIELRAGDKVPADARLEDADELLVDETALAGDGPPVQKDAQAIIEGIVPLSERLNSVFLGTTVIHGAGHAVVFATGARTEIGRLGRVVARSQVEPPLTQRVDRLELRVLTTCIAFGGFAVFGALLRPVVLRNAPEVSLLRVSFDVIALVLAMIPASLPLALAAALGSAQRRMAHAGVSLRNLPTAETLGVIDVACFTLRGALVIGAPDAQASEASAASHESTAEEGEALRSAVLHPEAPDALAAARALGVTPVIITAATEEEVRPWLETLGPLMAHAPVLTADAMEQPEWRRRVLDGEPVVFVRMTLLQKRSVVRRMTRAGRHVMFVGHAANDVAAMRASHVSVAIGAAPGSPAHEAANVWVESRALAGPIQALAIGRHVIAVLEHVLVYLLTSSFALGLTVTLGALGGFKHAFTPRMMLWVSLVVTAPVALALAVTHHSTGSNRRRAHFDLLSRAGSVAVGGAACLIAVGGLLLRAALLKQSSALALSAQLDWLSLTPLGAAVGWHLGALGPHGSHRFPKALTVGALLAVGLELLSSLEPTVRAWLQRSNALEAKPLLILSLGLLIVTLVTALVRWLSLHHAR